MSKMFIDELIQFCKRKSENIKLKAEPQVFIEIANKLEELKIYEECNIFKTNFSKGYNKAIDDFAYKLKIEISEEINSISERQKLHEVGSELCTTYSHIMGAYRDVYNRIVRKIAEQMKAGDNNDKR